MAPLILVIDDDFSLLELYRILFEMEGYQVHTSSCRIKTAWEIETLHPDLILTDFRLQRQPPGPDLWQLVKMHPPTAHIPVILCTAAVIEVHQQEQLLHQQGISLIYKPFDLDTLLTAVRHCLAQAAQERDGE
jgi:DNA-binding NtrC family response regulator